MRLNLDNIDEYDVRSLNGIAMAVESIYNKCGSLKEVAEIMESNVEVAERDFTSENMTRAKDLLNKYIVSLEDAQRELKELLDSVDDFTNKLKYAWRDW